MKELAERGPMQRKGVAKLATKMENFRDGLTSPSDVKSLGNDVFELRAKIGSDCFRLLFSYQPDDVVLALLGLYKDQNQIRRQERERAIQRHVDWIQRLR